MQKISDSMMKIQGWRIHKSRTRDKGWRLLLPGPKNVSIKNCSTEKLEWVNFDNK